jgi:putative flippase GtrA
MDRLLRDPDLPVISLTLKYALFAFIATLANMATQYGSFSVYGGVFSLYVAMAFGTLAGLVVKYILDKKYIFNYVVANRREDVRKFILYSLMGVFTTLIFWGFEIAFNTLFASAAAKYWGAAIGLAAGYTTKYQMDRKYVFTAPQSGNKNRSGSSTSSI